MHFAVTGAAGLDRRLVHGFDTACTDRGELCLVDRGKQADHGLGHLCQPGPADADPGRFEALMLAIQRDVPGELRHNPDYAANDIATSHFLTLDAHRGILAGRCLP